MKRPLIALLLLMATMPGCAIGETCFMASWEPEPDVFVTYSWTLGIPQPARVDAAHNDTPSETQNAPSRLRAS